MSFLSTGAKLGLRAMYTPSATPAMSRPMSSFFNSSQRPRPRPQNLFHPYALAFSLPFSLFGFTFPLGEKATAAPNTSVDSQSSTILREKSPAAIRPQATTLMFASVKEDQRYDWQEWIAYFRENGFDCIDANLDYQGAEATSKDAKTAESKEVDEPHQILADELTSQIRLCSLQRSPLLFIHAPSSSLNPLASKSASTIDVLQSHLESRPQIAGLIIVSKAGAWVGKDDEAKVEALSKILKGRVLVVKDDADGIREGERWLISKGF